MFAKKPDPKPTYVWPDCPPPDEGVFYSSLGDGRNQYKQVEVEPGRWQWVLDEEAMRRVREAEQRRNDLWWALRTRVLTEEEMTTVRQYGSSLNTPTGVSYYAHEKDRELNDALANQAKLRLLAAALSSPGEA